MGSRQWFLTPLSTDGFAPAAELVLPGRPPQHLPGAGWPRMSRDQDVTGVGVKDKCKNVDVLCPKGAAAILSLNFLCRAAQGAGF